MKHPYQPACTCGRCVKERGRRELQSQAGAARRGVTAQADRAGRFSRIARRERAFETWATTDDGPGAYEIDGPDRPTRDDLI